MKKNYTLSYFFNIYQNDQASLKQIGQGVKGDQMLLTLKEDWFSPSENSIQAILNFSKSYEVLSSRLTQHIEVIKN